MTLRRSFIAFQHLMSLKYHSHNKRFPTFICLPHLHLACRKSTVEIVQITLPPFRIASFAKIRDAQSVWVLFGEIYSAFFSARIKLPTFKYYRSKLSLKSRMANRSELRALRLLGATREREEPVSLLKLECACLAVRKLTGNSELADCLAAIAPATALGTKTAVQSPAEPPLAGKARMHTSPSCVL